DLRRDHRHVSRSEGRGDHAGPVKGTGASLYPAFVLFSAETRPDLAGWIAAGSRAGADLLPSLAGAVASSREEAGQWHVGAHDRRLEDNEAEILIDADIHIGQTLHDRLVLADAGGDEFQHVVVTS